MPDTDRPRLRRRDGFAARDAESGRASSYESSNSARRDAARANGSSVRSDRAPHKGGAQVPTAADPAPPAPAADRRHPQASRYPTADRCHASRNRRSATRSCCLVQDLRELPQDERSESESNRRLPVLRVERRSLRVRGSQDLVLPRLLEEELTGLHRQLAQSFAPLAHQVSGEAAPGLRPRRTRVRIPYAPSDSASRSD